MTQLKDPRGTIKIKLPSFPKDEVILYKGLLTHQVQNIVKVESDYDKGIEILKTMIKSWTFVDANNKELAVSAKSIGLLPAKDFAILMDEVNKEFDEVNSKKKKNLKE